MKRLSLPDPTVYRRDENVAAAAISLQRAEDVANSFSSGSSQQLWGTGGAGHPRKHDITSAVHILVVFKGQLLGVSKV